MNDEYKAVDEERTAIKNESGQVQYYAVPMPDYIKSLCKQYGIKLKSEGQPKQKKCPF